MMRSGAKVRQLSPIIFGESSDRQQRLNEVLRQLALAADPDEDSLSRLSLWMKTLQTIQQSAVARLTGWEPDYIKYFYSIPGAVEEIKELTQAFKDLSIVDVTHVAEFAEVINTRPERVKQSPIQ